MPLTGRNLVGRDRSASMVRSGARAFAASLVAVAAGFAVSVTVARALGPTGKGAYDLSMATGALLILALGLALPAGITFVVAKRRAGARPMLALRFCCPRPGHRFLDYPLCCRCDADSRIRRTCGLGPCHPGCRGRHRGCDLHGPRAEGDPGWARTHSRGYLARVVGRTLVLAMVVGLGWVLVVSTPTSVLTTVQRARGAEA